MYILKPYTPLPKTYTPPTPKNEKEKNKHTHNILDCKTLFSHRRLQYVLLKCLPGDNIQPHAVKKPTINIWKKTAVILEDTTSII